jgi:phage head maturation protease
MLVTMLTDQFQKGLAVIRNAFTDALTERAVVGAVVSHDFEGSEPRATTFTVTSQGQVQAQQFSREEIDDSGEAIDAPAAHKVRMVVSHFVR